MTRLENDANVGRLFEGAAPGPEPGSVDLSEVPEPARRYLETSLARDAAPIVGVHLTQRGRLRGGPDKPWMEYEAEQFIAPRRGFVWEATARSRLGPIRGRDLLVDDEAAVRFHLWRLLPVASASGPDVLRSARGRLAGERVWAPSFLLPAAGASWVVDDDERVHVRFPLVDHMQDLRLDLDDQGHLFGVHLQRWREGGPKGWTSRPYGVRVLARDRFQGHEVPTRIVATWNDGQPDAWDAMEVDVTSWRGVPAQDKKGT